MFVYIVFVANTRYNKLIPIVGIVSAVLRCNATGGTHILPPYTHKKIKLNIKPNLTKKSFTFTILFYHQNILHTSLQ